MQVLSLSSRYCTSFTLETDHKPLEWLKSHKQSHVWSQHLEQWSLKLRAYDFKVDYRPGKENLCADSLSRLPLSLVAWEKSMTLQQLSTAQDQDLEVLSIVRAQLKDHPSVMPTAPKWQKFSLFRYKQPWPHIKSNISSGEKSPTMVNERADACCCSPVPATILSHDQSGHQGAERTFDSQPTGWAWPKW